VIYFINSGVGIGFSGPDLNTNNGGDAILGPFRRSFVHTSLDTDIFQKASLSRFWPFGWSSQPGKCTSIGMSWFAVGTLFPLRSPSWTAKIDCKPASSAEISLHWPKMTGAAGAQPPCHTWLPWYSSHSSHVFHRIQPLLLTTFPYHWWQKRNNRMRRLSGKIIVFCLFHLSKLAKRQTFWLFPMYSGLWQARWSHGLLRW